MGLPGCCTSLVYIIMYCKLAKNEISVSRSCRSVTPLTMHKCHDLRINFFGPYIQVFTVPLYSHVLALDAETSILSMYLSGKMLDFWVEQYRRDMEYTMKPWYQDQGTFHIAGMFEIYGLLTQFRLARKNDESPGSMNHL